MLRPRSREEKSEQVRSEWPWAQALICGFAGANKQGCASTNTNLNIRPWSSFCPMRNKTYYFKNKVVSFSLFANHYFLFACGLFLELRSPQANEGMLLRMYPLPVDGGCASCRLLGAPEPTSSAPPPAVAPIGSHIQPPAGAEASCRACSNASQQLWLQAVCVPASQDSLWQQAPCAVT